MKRLFIWIAGAAPLLAAPAARAAGSTYSGLPVGRRMLFNKWEEPDPVTGAMNLVDYGDYYKPFAAGGWTHEGPGFPNFAPPAKKRLLAGTNHVHASGWAVVAGRTGSPSQLGASIPPETYDFPGSGVNSATNWQAGLQNVAGAYIESPFYPDGIGTIYFDAINNDAARPPVGLAVEISKNRDGGDWVQIAGTNVSGLVRFRHTIRFRGGIRFRILRTDSFDVSKDAAFLAVDNIQVSRPAAGVAVSRPEIARAPGKPTSAKISCVVSNEASGGVSDHDSRQVSVCYKSGSGDYFSAPMEYAAGSGDGAGNGERYAAEIDFPDGDATEDLTFYCICTVGGDRFLPIDHTGKGDRFWVTEDGAEPPVTGESVKRTENVSGWVTAASSDLPVERRMLFNKWEESDPETGARLNDYGDYYKPFAAGGWTHKGPGFPKFAPPAKRRLLAGTNHVHASGWAVVAGRTGSPSQLGAAIPPPEYGFPGSGVNSATNWQAGLQNVAGAYIESPFYPDGIGTIYFDAAANDPAYPVGMLVEVATNMFDDTVDPNSPANIMFDREFVETVEKEGGGIATNHIYRYHWAPLDDPLTVTTNLLHFQRRLLYRRGIRFRIRRKDKADGVSKDAAFLAIDNIQASRPPADVAFRREDVEILPPHPAPGEPFRIRCRVDNVDTNVPTDHANRMVTVHYRWRYLDQAFDPAGDEWHSADMDYQPGKDDRDGAGNGERYEATLPGQPREGDLEYYFVCHFDGFRYRPVDYTQTGHKYWPAAVEKGTEALPPRVLGSESGGDPGFTRRIRRAKSDFGAVSIETDSHTNAIPMTLEEDGLWRGWVPLHIGTTSVTNFRFRFRFDGVYDPDAETVAMLPVFWAEAGAGLEGRKPAKLPSGGICADVTDAPDAWMPVSEPDARYAMVKLDPEKREYTICRADYQNFDDWIARDDPAPADIFSDSGWQSLKRKYEETFDGRDQDADSVWEQYFANPGPGGDYVNSFLTIAPRWIARSARYEEERKLAGGKNRPNAAGDWQNHALRLMGMDSFAHNTKGLVELGSVYTAPETLTDGLREFSFKARAGSGIAPGRMAYCTSKFDTGPCTISASIAAQDASPGVHSVSLVGHYRDAGNFFELRIVQIVNRADLRKNRISLELYRRVNRVETLLGRKEFDGTIGGAFAKLDLSNGTSVSGMYGDKKIGPFTCSYMSDRGTFGFMAADCRLSAGRVTLELTDAGPGSDIPYDRKTWSLADGAFEISGDNQILSRTPRQKIGVYTLKTDFAEPGYPPSAIDEWELRGTVTLDSFDYPVSPFKFIWRDWQAEYVRLQVLSSPDNGYDAVVDELVASSWHGKMTPPVEGRAASGGIYDYNEEWLAMEAWMTSDGGNRIVELNSSRANPDPDWYDDWKNLPKRKYKYRGPQGVRSPLLKKGCGSMELVCRVEDASRPVRLTLQRADATNPDMWRDCTWMEGSPNAGKRKSVIVTNTVYRRLPFYVGNATGGFLRVVNDFRDDAGDGLPTCRNGVLKIDTAAAWDEPFADTASWRVYNAMITDRDKARAILDESRGCTLNNSETVDTAPVQDQAPPFLKAPLLLSGGLGEISFDARTYDTNGTVDVYVYVTKSDWNALSENWILAATVTVDTAYFKRYVFSVGQDNKDSKGVRLQTRAGEGARRVCIENVSVSEPVDPGFDITDTRPICQMDNESYREDPVQQPLNLDKVGLEARISNVRMSPANIRVYADYYIGTNAWGVGNWPFIRRLELFPLTNNPAVYRTRVDEGFGFLDTGDVVQYKVWASCTDAEGRKRYTVEQRPADFVNPPWYEPVDLNKTFRDRGRSPYFMVYDIPLGCVFINEANIYETADILQNGEHPEYYLPYIEIAVPEIVMGDDLQGLKGWKLAIVSGDYYETTNRIFLPDNARKTAATNGYAFYVVGMTAGDIANIEGAAGLDAGYVDYGDKGFISKIAQYANGAILLERPMGMVEHSVAYFGYGVDYGFGREWADNAPGGGLLYAGADGPSNSLSVVANNGARAAEWRHLPWTPGRPNVGQTLPEIQAISFGNSNVIVTARMDPESFKQATQNGARRDIFFRLPCGASTNIVYNLKPWYRMASVTVNGKDERASLVLEHATNSVYTLPLNDLQTNTVVSARVAIAPELLDTNLHPVVRNWVMSYPDMPLAGSTYNGNPMSLTQLYWFDADPTVPHAIEGSITGIEIDPDTNFYITASLAVDGANCTNLNSGAYLDPKDGKTKTKCATFKIMVRQRLAPGSDWELLPPQYAITPGSFDTNHECRIFIPNPFSRQPAWLYGRDPSSLFFRWQIEFDEEGFWISAMTNHPAAAPAP